MSVLAPAPVPASVAREELRVFIRYQLESLARRPDAAGRCADAILDAAVRYRNEGRTAHLEGTAGAQTACQYRWPEPGLLALTGDLADVTCQRCRKSRRYRDLTAGGGNG